MKELTMRQAGRDLSTLVTRSRFTPFLNKNIYEMIRLARRKGIVVLSSTNGNVTTRDGA